MCISFQFAKLDFSSDSSEKNFSDAVRNIQLAHNMSLNAESMFGWNVQSDESKLEKTFIFNPTLRIYTMCYSSNFHLNDSEEAETHKI
ncbi:hypothetical protein TNCT_136901, partial [Trichonephila clavata]